MGPSPRSGAVDGVKRFLINRFRVRGRQTPCAPIVRPGLQKVNRSAHEASGRGEASVSRGRAGGRSGPNLPLKQAGYRRGNHGYEQQGTRKMLDGQPRGAEEIRSQQPNKKSCERYGLARRSSCKASNPSANVPANTRNRAHRRIRRNVAGIPWPEERPAFVDWSPQTPADQRRQRRHRSTDLGGVRRHTLWMIHPVSPSSPTELSEGIESGGPFQAKAPDCDRPSSKTSG